LENKLIKIYNIRDEDFIYDLIKKHKNLIKIEYKKVLNLQINKQLKHIIEILKPIIIKLVKESLLESNNIHKAYF
jgi:hypothetical protein